MRPHECSLCEDSGLVPTCAHDGLYACHVCTDDVTVMLTPATCPCRDGYTTYDENGVPGDVL